MRREEGEYPLPTDFLEVGESSTREQRRSETVKREKVLRGLVSERAAGGLRQF